MITEVWRAPGDTKPPTKRVHLRGKQGDPHNTVGSTLCGVHYRYEPSSRAVRVTDTFDEVTCNRCRSRLFPPPRPVSVPSTLRLQTVDRLRALHVCFCGVHRAYGGCAQCGWRKPT